MSLLTSKARFFKMCALLARELGECTGATRRARCHHQRCDQSAEAAFILMIQLVGIDCEYCCARTSFSFDDYYRAGSSARVLRYDASHPSNMFLYFFAPIVFRFWRRQITLTYYCHHYKARAPVRRTKLVGLMEIQRNKPKPDTCRLNTIYTRCV